MHIYTSKDSPYYNSDWPFASVYLDGEHATGDGSSVIGASEEEGWVDSHARNPDGTTRMISKREPMIERRCGKVEIVIDEQLKNDVREIAYNLSYKAGMNITDFIAAVRRDQIHVSRVEGIMKKIESGPLAYLEMNSHRRAACRGVTRLLASRIMLTVLEKGPESIYQAAHLDAWAKLLYRRMEMTYLGRTPEDLDHEDQ